MASHEKSSPVHTNDHDDSADCALSTHDQERNVWCYVAQISLTYLAAPALYIGFIQAGLCTRLNTSNTIANLPSAIFLSMSWTTVVIAWLYPQARLLKRMLTLSYFLLALAGMCVATILLAEPSTTLIVSALVLHAGLVGVAAPLIGVLNWEVLDRGLSARMRGRALGLAFGIGPAFAVIGSLGAQFLLDGKVFHINESSTRIISYPYNYATIFGVSSICALGAGWTVMGFKFNLPKTEATRETFRVAVIGGFRSFFAHPVLRLSCIAYLLVYCGNLVQINMSLFTFEAIGKPSEDLAGYQLTLRFSFKVVCGFFLGWLLTRTNPKVPLLVTLGLQIAGVLWVLLVPGYWFLLAFGINGAAELFGVYYINYPAQCSPRSHVRRNISFLGITSSIVAFAPIVYGTISDMWSLRTSFFAALVLLVSTGIFVVSRLPSNPSLMAAK